MRQRAFAWLLVLLTLLAGCATGPAYERPQNFAEQILYAEGAAKAALRTIGDLTCYKGYDAAGNCLEPGHPISPQKSLELIDSVDEVRSAIKAAPMIPEGGVGPCLGAERTQIDCLRAIQQATLKLESYLTAQKGK